MDMRAFIAWLPRVPRVKNSLNRKYRDFGNWQQKQISAQVN